MGSAARTAVACPVGATTVAPYWQDRDGELDPEMHQTKKGNEWHFGMKAHIGVDSRHKSQMRAKVEHSFLVLKVIFGFRKVRYRGIAKKAQRLNVACALTNLFMLLRPLLRLA